METEEFEQHVQDHMVHNLDLNYCVIALNEEAGEIAGWYKKAILRGDPSYTDNQLLGELGDLLFYLTRTAQCKGWSLSDVMDFNKTKLDERKGWKTASSSSVAESQD